jgi:hypothetical protein
MNLERTLRLIAGVFVTASVLLGMYVHPYFLFFTIFVGLNLFQSGLSNWCPMMTFLTRSGVCEPMGRPANAPRHKLAIPSEEPHARQPKSAA